MKISLFCQWRIIALSLVICGACPNIAFGHEDVNRILWINTYSADDVDTQEIISGFRTALRDRDLWVNYETYDLGLRYQPLVAVSPGDIEALRAKLALTHYDLIVTLDTIATELILNQVLVPDPKTPILAISYFSSAPLAERIPSSMNMSGVQTTTNLRDNIMLARRLLPDLSEVTLIVEATSGDYTPPPALRTIPPEWNLKINVISGNLYTTEEMLDAVSRLPEDSLLMFQSWASQKELKPEHSYTVLPRIKKIFPGLILGKYDSYIGYGTAGGLIPSNRMQGILGGQIAARALKGESLQSIPVVLSKLNTVLDYAELERLHIPISRAPEETVFVNEPPEFIIAHRFQLLYLTGALLAALLAWIVILTYRRTAQRRMETIFGALPSRIAVIARSGKVLYSRRTATNPARLRHLDELLKIYPPIFFKELDDAFNTGGIRDFEFQKLGAEWLSARLVTLPAPNLFRQDVVIYIGSDITALHNANTENEAMAKRFQLTLNSIADGVIATDSAEQITLFNPVAAELTGYSSEEAIGRNLSEIFHRVGRSGISPQESPLRKALRTGEAVPMDDHSELVGKNGRRRHIADNAAPIFDSDKALAGGVLIFRDISEEHRRNDQLRTHNILLDTVIKITRMVCFRLDQAGRLRFTTSPEIGSTNAREVWTLADRIAPADAAEFQLKLDRVISGGVSDMNMTYSIPAKEGAAYFEIHIARIFNEMSGAYEFCGVIQDITRARSNEMRYRDNLQLQETIIQNLPGFFFAKDVEDDFRYVMTNRGHSEVIGLPCSEIMNKFDSELFQLDAEATRKIQEEDRKLADSDSVLDTQDVFINRVQKRFVVRTIKKIIKKSDGSRLMIGMGIDTTRQYDLEQEQQRSIDALNNYISSERVINQLLARITLEENFDRAVNEMLRIIGENTKADRCYIFRYLDNDYIKFSNTFEWVGEGTEPVIDTLQEVDCSNFHAWRNTLLERRPLILADLENPPPDFSEQEIEGLRFQGIKSLLVSGIWLDNKLQGFVGIDFVGEKKNFTDCEIHTVNSVANLFTLAYERARQREQTLESVSLLRQIMDNINIPVLLVDTNYNVLMANPTKKVNVEMPLDRLLGTHCYDNVCKFGAPPEFCSVAETIRTKKPSSKEFSFGEKRLISTAQPIFDLAGNLKSVLNVDIDITEITRQKEELKVAVEQAQAANRAKSYFLATVSHELRTPLNAVIGFSELLQNGGVDEKTQQEYLHSINFAGTSLLKLINDVLDLSNLEADKMLVAPALNDVADLIRQVAGVFKLKAIEKNLELEADVAGITQMLYVDNLRLRQILLNLLGNAMKFTSAGRVAIKGVFTPENAETGVLEISVADTGIGMAPENREKIFEPFVHDSIIRGKWMYEGSGLGLTITRKLLDRMNGKITLESELGKGSTFTIRLESVKYELPQANALAPAATAASAQADKQLHFLLVDDVPLNLKVLAAMLKRQGIASELANSAAEAMEQLAADQAFDVVLTDMWMPETCGAELAEQLRNNPAFANMPIVAVTADTQVANTDKQRFDYILHKPITEESIQLMLKSVMPAVTTSRRPAE